MADLNKVITLSVNTGDSNEYVKALVDHFVKLDKEINNANKSAKSLNDTFIVSNKYRKRTEATILREINAVKLNRKAYAETTIQYAQFTDQIQLLEIELGQLRGKIDSSGAAVKGMRNNAGLASQTLVEMGRTISDSNYGFTAMANNLSQLGYYMTTLIAESGGVKNTLKSLGRQIMGAGGIVIGLQILIAVVEKYTMKQREANQEVDKLTDSLADANGVINKLRLLKGIVDDTNSSISEQESALRALKKDGYDETIGSIDDYIEAKERLLRYNALEQLRQEQLKKTFSEEIKLRKAMKDDIEATEKDIAKVYEKGGVVLSAREGYSIAAKDYDKRETDSLNERIAVYGEKIGELLKEQKGFNDIVVEQFKQSTNALKDNPFYCLFFGDCKDDSLNKTLKRQKYLYTVTKFYRDKDLESLEDYWKRRTETEQNTLEAQEQIRQKRLSELASGLQATSELIGATGDILNAEFDRQLTLERNKTNEINNELKARLRNEALSMEQRKNIQNQIAQNDEKLRLKQLEIEKKKFKANKAIEMSNAIVNTAAAATGVLKDTKGGSIARIAGMIAVIGAGLAQVAIIARQKFQTSAASMTGGVTNVDTGDGGGAIAGPSFNVVGQSGSNQLARAVSGQLSKPVKAYVVSKDVSTSQEMDRNVVKTASLG